MHNRQADTHIRFCIAVCVFIVLITLPLHFSDIEEISETQFGAGTLGTNILNCHFNHHAQKLRFTYINGFKFPKKSSFTCFITVFDSQQNPIPLKQSTQKMHLGGGAQRNTLSFHVQLKNPSNTDGKPDGEINGKARKQKINKRKNINNCTVRIRISDTTGKYLCTITGKSMRLKSYLQNMRFEYPRTQ